MQPDSLIEIKPVGKTGGEIVWEWHLWDHLIQDVDKDKANFGDVLAHPERVDINFNVVAGRRANPDWSHFNAVAYNARSRSSGLSLRTFGEIWIIDHSTTTKEAPVEPEASAARAGTSCIAGESSGVSSRNSSGPATLRTAQRPLDSPGSGGAGHMLIFNNGDTRPGTRYSSVERCVARRHEWAIHA